MSNTTSTTFGPHTPATIVADYATMTTAEKAHARTYAESMMKDAIDRAIAGDMTGVTDAGAWKDARESRVSTPVKVAVDHTATVSDLAASLIAAAHDLARVGVTIDGVTYRATLDGSPVSADVARFTVVKSRKANRGAVVAWIESVVDDKPAKISELRSRWVATDDYPKSAPSAGAIGAAFDRVDAGADADFVTVDIDGKRGAQVA